MAEVIRVLLLDAAPETHQRVAECLAGDPGIQVAGRAFGDAEALARVETLRPDVVLVDFDLPEQGGLHVAEQINGRFPWVSVIVLSQVADTSRLRDAMLVGARHFLVKPFEEGELPESIRRVYRLDAMRRGAYHSAPAASDAIRPAPVAPASAAGASRDGKVFTFYSAKGGVGCTTLACNTAIALKQATGKEVAIFDCGLLFGDVGVVLNLNPRQTIIDVLPRLATLDGDYLSQMMITHASGVQVLLAPASPEKAELITAEHIRRVLAALRERFDYVVIDTWPTFEERILHVLDASDIIVVPTTLEMPSIKNCKLLMDVTTALNYPPEKVALILNRADSKGGIRTADVEHILQRRFAAEIVSDGRLTTLSLNEGAPFVMTHPDAPISLNIRQLAASLAGLPDPMAEAAKQGRRGAGLFRAVFGSAGGA